jgi:hypothetical protein
MLLREDDKHLLKYIRMQCKAEDLIRASHVSHFLQLRHFLQFIFTTKQFFQQIFVLVIINAYWIVYCINKFHKQVEILDPQNWEQKDDKNRYHAAISVQIRGRLNNVFQMFAGSLFPDILN